MRILLCLTLAGFIASPAYAEQVICDSHAEMVKMLSGEFGEMSTGRGITNEGDGLVEIFTSKNDTFTILFVRPDGTSCLIAAGKHWTKPAKPKADPKTSI